MIGFQGTYPPLLLIFSTVFDNIFKNMYLKGGVIVIKIKQCLDLSINVVIAIEIILIIVFYVPTIFGLKTYVVTSGSMEPMYPVGSLIYVKNIQFNEVKENDVITFYMEDTDIVATHQVYEIDQVNKNFKTQGINNKDETGEIIKDVLPVKSSSLIGKPIVCIKYLGFVNRFITSQFILPLILILTAILVMIYYFIEKIMEGKYEKREKK